MDWTSILRAGDDPAPRRRRKARPLPEPTTALPGTPEKEAVLTRRRRLGQELWHPLDPTIESANLMRLGLQSERLRNGRDSTEETVVDHGGLRELRSQNDASLPPDHRAIPADRRPGVRGPGH